MKPSIRILIPLILLFFCLGIAFAQTDFQQADDHLAGLIQRAKTGIVAIGTFNYSNKPMVTFYGTGFAIGNGSRIVTNHHVIEAVKEKNQLFHLRIFHERLPERGVKAKVVAEDGFHDLTILEMEQTRLPALALETPGSVQEGHQVAFTGYPIGFVLGLNPTTHIGIISAISPLILPSPSAAIIDGELIKHLSQPYDVFQIDATAYPGNSGSPVYRIATGQVVGVINRVFIKGKKEHVLKDPTGITYAIPIKFVHRLNQTIP